MSVLLVLVLYMGTLAILANGQVEENPQSMPEKKVACSKDLISNFTNAIMMCNNMTIGSSETNGTSSAELDMSMKATSTIPSSKIHKDEMLSLSRRRRNDENKNATKMMDQDNKMEEEHSQLMLCVVSSLRMNFPAMEAIYKYCNMSHTMGDGDMESTTIKEPMSTTDKMTDDNGHHMDGSDDMEDNQEMHSVYISKCLDEKLRLMCPDFDVRAHSHIM